MGYRLKCFVVSCNEDTVAEAILRAAATRFPFGKSRRFQAPFPGLIVDLGIEEAYEDYQLHPEKYSFQDEDAAYEAILEVRSPLSELSRLFPNHPLGYIDVDCFGGVCMYEGFVVQDGKDLFQTQGSSANGHLEVLQNAGAPHSDWYFEPFTRGYFREDYQPPERRPRGVTGALRGHIRGANASVLPIHLTMELKEPWRLSRMMETWLVSHGEEDVWFSLNTRDEHTLELGGRTHAEPAEAARLMAEFLQKGPADLDLDYEVELRDLGSTVLETWKGSSR